MFIFFKCDDSLNFNFNSEVELFTNTSKVSTEAIRCESFVTHLFVIDNESISKIRLIFIPPNQHAYIICFHIQDNQN